MEIDLKLCTYLTEEDTYLAFDRKKSGSFQTLRYVGLRFMLGGKLAFSISSTFFLSKQFETLYKCYGHTVKVYVLFYKGNKAVPETVWKVIIDFFLFFSFWLKLQIQK